MEELLAECLRTLEDAGEHELQRFLAAHPAERAELEACLAELWSAGLVDHQADSRASQRRGPAERFPRFRP